MRESKVRRTNLLKAGLVLLAGFMAMLAWAPAVLADQVVILQTTKGPIAIRVFENAVPYTAGNFLELVSRGFYNGLTFHRVEHWVIQGGDPSGNGTGNFIDPNTGQPRYLRLETNRDLRHNAPGVVAMAHAKSPNSGSCQFYITKKPMPALDGGYSIFGGVIQGMQTVYNIQPGDRILSAEIYGGGGGGGGNRGGGGGGGSGGGGGGGGRGPRNPAPPPPATGDSGF